MPSGLGIGSRLVTHRETRRTSHLELMSWSTTPFVHKIRAPRSPRFLVSLLGASRSSNGAAIEPASDKPGRVPCSTAVSIRCRVATLQPLARVAKALSHVKWDASAGRCRLSGARRFRSKRSSSRSARAEFASHAGFSNAVNGVTNRRRCWSDEGYRTLLRAPRRIDRRCSLEPAVPELHRRLPRALHRHLTSVTSSRQRRRSSIFPTL